MKNIHIIPTDKPSRLHLGNSGLVLCDLNFNKNTINSRNIFITSDEEIKDGDWCYDDKYKQPFQCLRNQKDGVYEWKDGNSWARLHKNCKKIILTTDEDLIKDGVQRIDDEFLEWFVKNPNCEEVEVENGGPGFPGGIYFINYLPEHFEKIIIPKEEHKQIKCYDKYNQLLSEGDYVDVQKDGVQIIYKKEDNQLYFKPYGEEDRVSAYFSNDLAKCDEVGNWINNDRYEDIVEEPKQEKLEEFVENKFGLVDPILGKSDYRIGYERGLIKGAKWQQERTYSEEEVRNIIFKFTNDFDMKKNIEITSEEQNKWLTQFKKK